MRTRNTLIVLTSVCGFAISALGAQLSALRVKKASVPPRLDGKLDEVRLSLRIKTKQEIGESMRVLYSHPINSQSLGAYQLGV